MKKKGSAILIATLLVTAIGSLAFSFGKILLADITSASIYENGVGSYYSAESGIEEGMLRYRFSSSATVPETGWGLDNSDLVYRSDLTTKTLDTGLSAGVSRAGDVAESADQIYDLRLGYMGSGANQPFWGEDLSSPQNGLDLADLAEDKYGVSIPSLKIPKDEVARIAIPSNFAITGIDGALNLLVVFEDPTDPSATVENAKAIVEVKAVVKKPTLLTKIFEYKKMVALSSQDAANNIGGDVSKDYIPNSLTSSSVGLRMMKGLEITDLLLGLGIFPESGMEVEFSFRPLFNNIRIGLSTTGCRYGLLGTCTGEAGTVIPGPVARIVSSGHYADSIKTLEANVDRQSGTLYDLYDNVIYSANNGSTYSLTFQNSGDCLAKVIINGVDHLIPASSGLTPGSIAVSYAQGSSLTMSLVGAGVGVCSPNPINPMQDITDGLSSPVNISGTYTLSKNSTISASTYTTPQ